MGNDNKSLELQIRIATQEALASVNSLKGELQSFAAEASKLSGSANLSNTFQSAQQAAEKAAASIKLFGASSSDLRHVQAELKNAAVELVRNGIDPQNAEVKKLVEEYKRLEKAAGDLDDANGKNIGSFGDLKRTVMSLAEVAAALKALSVIKDMGAFALQTADSFQAARNQFGTLLGDMQAGAGLFNEIKAFNDVTPFDLDTLTQATNVLIAAKVPLKDLQSQLTKFGDLSQGNSQKMTSYVNAFSQAAAKGKADMQVLNTYLHQGVPILDALAKGFGVTTAEVVEMSSKGQISFADFSKALDDLTAAGGQYFGGMELASQSLSAMQEGLREAVNSLAASFGDMLMPAAVAVVGALTEITNAINESPIAKGLLAGALGALTGYLAAMAVKSTVAFARQMALNFAIGAMNPAVMAATVAAGVLAAGYIGFSAHAQKAARDAENAALAQRKHNDSLDAGAGSLENYINKIKELKINEIWQEIEASRAAMEWSMNNGGDGSYWAGQISLLRNELRNRRDEFVKELYKDPEDKMKTLSQTVEVAQQFLLAVEIEIPPEEKAKLDAIIKYSQEELNKLITETTGWRKTLKSAMDFSSEDAAAGLLSTAGGAIDEYAKRLKDAEERAISFDDVLGDEASALQNTAGQWERLLSAMIESGHWEREEESVQKVVAALENARKAAGEAGYAKTIADLRKKIDDFGKSEAQLAYEAAIANGALAEQAEEIRDLIDEYSKLNEPIKDLEINIKDWQQELSDSFTQALMDIKGFSAEAAVVIGDLAAQLASLSIDASLSGFEEFGRALGEGKDAAESLSAALAAMCQQILKQLPMMFLQAGLQLIANGQWPLGLGFIAAAGSTAIISGYVDGASKHAQGGVFDEYGRAARAFAAGGAFTNQIVSAPTYFRYGGGFDLGLMGEAGPEAVVPLTRMGDGSLGVRTENGGGTKVVVNIINNSGGEVKQEEHEDGEGNRQIDVIIGDLVNNHLGSGKADRVLSGRYGLRAAGV